ncbi:hypothetical protein [Paraburkholderia diazotrophica]|uniref:Uncharacterized protein n=1 Tax=Paraburkholderia diazotrophica TaxID=667676 RepID=A0A1H7DHP6_9BURK|nr:hypothetical protein [Paraburkholderia diazotrophica]SEK01158.1 hypothetical protein SAMN05192539_103029 [Paraburkholderia diazotrophica]
MPTKPSQGDNPIRHDQSDPPAPGTVKTDLPNVGPPQDPDAPPLDPDDNPDYEDDKP